MSDKGNLASALSGGVPEVEAATVTCDACGVEITTGVQAMLCPRADECDLWPTGCDIETERMAWRMWKGYAHQAFDGMKAERDQLERELIAWKDFAEHVEVCVECGIMGPTSCHDGNELKQAALASASGTPQDNASPK